MTGLSNVPGTGRGLLVANHSGVLPWDGAMIKTGLRLEHPARRDARMLILDMFTMLPFLQPWLRQMGEVRACPENGERLLKRDELVCVFPEGIKGVGKLYRDRYRLARFGRGGFVRLALRSRAPIIPATVVGAEEIYPNLLRLDFIGRPIGLPVLPDHAALPGPRPARRDSPSDQVVDRLREADRLRARARAGRPSDDRERACGQGPDDASDDDRLSPRAPRGRLHGRVAALRPGGSVSFCPLRTCQAKAGGDARLFSSGRRGWWAGTASGSSSRTRSGSA